MTDQRINDYTLEQECKSLAQDILNEVIEEMQDDETLEDHEDTLSDRAHEMVDGHQWVIYYHYAHQIASSCNTDNGEQYLEDTGMPETPTYNSLAVIIAYGEMLARVQNNLATLVSEYEK